MGLLANYWESDYFEALLVFGVCLIPISLVFITVATRYRLNRNYEPIATKLGLKYSSIGWGRSVRLTGTVHGCEFSFDQGATNNRISLARILISFLIFGSREYNTSCYKITIPAELPSRFSLIEKRADSRLAKLISGAKDLPSSMVIEDFANCYRLETTFDSERLRKFLTINVQTSLLDANSMFPGISIKGGQLIWFPRLSFSAILFFSPVRSDKFLDAAAKLTSLAKSLSEEFKKSGEH
jgi:hypothetical protein